MKKNNLLRIASILLVAVLLTTSVVSGTFAKYTTQDSGNDVARVAKWGVELQVVGNLYGEHYDEGTVAPTAYTTADAETVTVCATGTNVVAPGTKNDAGFTFSLKGTPEVSGIATTTMKIQNVFLAEGSYGLMIPVDAGVVTAGTFDRFDLYQKDGDNFVAATAFATGTNYYTLEDAVTTDAYYPVVYNLAGPTSNTGAITADSLKAAADLIAGQLGLTAGAAASDTSITYTGTKSFVPNTDLASWKVGGETLTWVWAFEGSGAGDSAATTDKADTILGLIENTVEGTVVKLDGTIYKPVVEYTDYCIDTMFSIDITVTQVD